MPEVQEVFRMATQKVRQDPGAQDRLEGRRRRNDRNRRVGAFALVLVLIAVAVAAFARAQSHSNGAPANPVSPTPVRPTVRATGDLTNSIVDLRSDAITPLPTSVWGAYYAGSPDGTRIAYSSCCSDSGTVYVANLDGTHASVISPPGFGGMGAQWLPGGAQVVYQQRAGTGNQLGKLVIHDDATGHDTTVENFGTSANGWWFLFPSSAPHGRILYQRPHGSTWNLWSVSASGGGQPTLVQRHAFWGGISADGTLAYVSPVDPELFAGSRLVVRPAGGGHARVLARGGAVSWVRWSPDGTRIAYRDGGTIYVVDVASGKISKIGTGETVEWLNDHALLVGPGGG